MNAAADTAAAHHRQMTTSSHSLCTASDAVQDRKLPETPLLSSFTHNPNIGSARVLLLSTTIRNHSYKYFQPSTKTCAPLGHAWPHASARMHIQMLRHIAVWVNLLHAYRWSTIRRTVKLPQPPRSATNPRCLTIYSPLPVIDVIIMRSKQHQHTGCTGSARV